MAMMEDSLSCKGPFEPFISVFSIPRPLSLLYLVAGLRERDGVGLQKLE